MKFDHNNFYGNQKLKSFGFPTYESLHAKGGKNMADLKQEAKNYEPKVTKNIADLEKVPINMEVKSKTVSEGTADEFTYNYIEVEGEEYRVPASVLKSLKAIIEEKPDMAIFKVVKKGEGMKTEYTVIPL